MPTEELNSLIVGVVGHAMTLFPAVVVFALTVMSNHVHAMLRAPPDELAAFVGFVKREISRRHGPKIGWSGTMWDEYTATALPTAESQINCLKYLLSQAVKEGLVESPLDWPGVHVAKALLDDEPLRGVWFDATAYGRAVRKQQSRSSPKTVDKQRFSTSIDVRLDKIPAWSSLSGAEYRLQVRGLLDEIVVEGREARGGRRVLGVRRVLATPRTLKRSLPPPPWWEERRRMICWADAKATETLEYTKRYWAFQHAFRAASAARREGKAEPSFPAGAFRPMRFCRMSGESHRRVA